MASKPLVVIVGPTASGKTALAIELAGRFSGEIICADSRTVYKGMDIGTAKPTKNERAAVPHWGLDIVEPGERFTAADFQKYALEKIEEIRSRGKVPFLVGGTGLYVDSVIYEFEFGGETDQERRSELEAMELMDLYKYCIKNNIKLPENSSNKRYLIRAIEQGGINNKRSRTVPDNTVIVGISTDKEMLRTKIEHRIEQLFQDGVVEEAKILGEKYGWDNEAMTGNIYPIVHKLLAGDCTIAEAKALCVTADWRLAKRQITWLKRNTDIKRLSLNNARSYLISILAV